jgi:hypothetical protein
MMHRSTVTTDVADGFGLDFQLQATNIDETNSADIQYLWRVLGVRDDTASLKASKLTFHYATAGTTWSDYHLIDPKEGVLVWQSGISTSNLPWFESGSFLSRYNFVTSSTAAEQDNGLSVSQNTNSDDLNSRGSTLSFLGKTAAQGLHRLAGISAYHDTADSDFDGHLELFVNEASVSSQNRAHRARLFSDGGFQSQTSGRGHIRFEDLTGSGAGAGNFTVHGTKWLSSPTRIVGGAYGDHYTVDVATGRDSGATFVQSSPFVEVEDEDYDAYVVPGTITVFRIFVFDRATRTVGHYPVTVKVTWFSDQNV